MLRGRLLRPAARRPSLSAGWCPRWDSDPRPRHSSKPRSIQLSYEDTSLTKRLTPD